MAGRPTLSGDYEPASTFWEAVSTVQGSPQPKRQIPSGCTQEKRQGLDPPTHNDDRLSLRQRRQQDPIALKILSIAKSKLSHKAGCVHVLLQRESLARSFRNTTAYTP